MASQRLAANGEAAHVGPVIGVGDAQLQKARATELPYQRPAGGIGIGGMRVVDRLLAPLLDPLRKLAVPRFEERPGKEVSIGHQSPLNSGVRLPAKAS